MATVIATTDPMYMNDAQATMVLMPKHAVVKSHIDSNGKAMILLAIIAMVLLFLWARNSKK